MLEITPYVGNTSVLSVCFHVEYQARMAIEAYARRDRTVWEQRLWDFAEEQGLPDWMPEWLAIFNAGFHEAFPDALLADHWRHSMNLYYPMGKEGSRAYELTNLVAEFRKKTVEEYSKIEPWPAYYLRPIDVKDWNDDDPLQPFAVAATVALEDLRSPVGVRDQSINAFGEAESGISSVRAAPSAGYPSGALGNAAAKEFADLHGLILKLGNGNAKRGIKKVMAAIGAKDPG